MPKSKYRRACDGNVSEYESENDAGHIVVYKPKEYLGKGVYAECRLFVSQDKQQKKKVILRPLKSEYGVNFAEVRRKKAFTKALYRKASLFEYAKDQGYAYDDYRYAAGFVPGRNYATVDLKYDAVTLEELFLAAAKCVKRAHNNNFVILDLNPDNIFYDKQKKRSKLIDGGSAVSIGNPIPSDYQLENQKATESKKEKHIFVAPECFSIRPVAVRATKEMDIYSLGMMMQVFIMQDKIPINDRPLNKKLMNLIAGCLEENPSARPQLNHLISELQKLLQKKNPDIKAKAALESENYENGSTECKAKCFMNCLTM